MAYIMLGGGGFALELYGYMKDDGCEVKGYYAQEEHAELSEWIPWLGDTDTVLDEDLDKEAEYIITVRLIKYRKKMIRFIEEHAKIFHERLAPLLFDQTAIFGG